MEFLLWKHFARSQTKHSGTETQPIKMSLTLQLEFKGKILKSLRWEHITAIFGTRSISGNWFSSRGRFLIGKPGQGVIRSQRFVIIITQWLLCDYQTIRFIGNRHMVCNWWWGWWWMVKLKLMKFDSLHIGSWGRLPKVAQPNKAIASLPRTTPALAKIYCARSDNLWLLRLKISWTILVFWIR